MIIVIRRVHTLSLALFAEWVVCKDRILIGILLQLLFIDKTIILLREHPLKLHPNHPP